MIKISAVIISFNEERNIERCLKSLQNVADEILVLDSFSTDKTEEICRIYGVNFQQHVFDGHIQQKNRAVQLAANDYVLSLDADEALSDLLKNEIVKIKQNPSADGYKFNRLTNYLGQWIHHSGWYPDTKLRLWNRNKGQWGGTNPHDKVVMNAKIKISSLKGDILHYSYYSLEEHIAQNNYFTTIGAKELHRKGKKSNLVLAILKGYWMFFRNYFIKLGFLDGVYGFVICKFTAHATFTKYMKLRDLNKNS